MTFCIEHIYHSMSTMGTRKPVTEVEIGGRASPVQVANQFCQHNEYRTQSECYPRLLDGGKEARPIGRPKVQPFLRVNAARNGIPTLRKTRNIVTGTGVRVEDELVE